MVQHSRIYDQGLLMAAFRASLPRLHQWGREERFRADGSVRGQTVVKKLGAVGRNDPCPCGSGKKFKKCCIDLLS